MRLDHATWPEVESYLETRRAVILPVGSTEQHGPVGLIGTDALCAEAIAIRAGDLAGVFVAPVLAYTPAPFNMGFPGTVSLSAATFRAVFSEVVEALLSHGFTRLYVLNAHGANLEPMRAVAAEDPRIRIRSWWEFERVNALRRAYYGHWEGLHATPSETAITRACHRVVEHPEAETPPRRLSAEELRAHAGDRHGPAEVHKADFPDGRVGAHSALGTAAQGDALLTAAADSLAEDLRAFEAGTTR